ncbi:hypothetical protein ACFLSA_06090, partial [Bacteroidota bacterium]
APGSKTENAKIKLEQTERNTYKIIWQKGELEVNLVPVNSFLPLTGYAQPTFGGKLIFLHDNVGIISLRIKGCPPVPRICWDNREHHYWQGFNGGFRPRNTVVNDIKIAPSDDGASIRISFYYIVDFVKTTISWLFTEPGDDCAASWDTFFSFENVGTEPMIKYMQFFACYHQSGKNYYWDRHDKITECTDGFSGYPDEGKMLRAAEIMAEYGELAKGWTAGIDNPSRSKEIYGNPVLLSEPREWFNHGQHVLMVEPAKCLYITSAMRQARDYMLAPAETDLNPGAKFTARVRHVIKRIGGINDVKRLWDGFLDDIAKNHQSG